MEVPPVRKSPDTGFEDPVIPAGTAVDAPSKPTSMACKRRNFPVERSEKENTLEVRNAVMFTAI